MYFDATKTSCFSPLLFATGKRLGKKVWDFILKNAAFQYTKVETAQNN